MKFLLSILLVILCLQIFANGKDDYSSIVKDSPSSLDSPLSDIQWCGENPSNDQKVVLLTSKGSVYRSEDRGVNWIRMTDSFTKAGINAKMDVNSNVYYF